MDFEIGSWKLSIEVIRSPEWRPGSIGQRIHDFRPKTSLEVAPSRLSIEAWRSEIDVRLQSPASRKVRCKMYLIAKLHYKFAVLNFTIKLYF